MRALLFLACVGVTVSGVALWPRAASAHAVAGDKKAKGGVDLPTGDPVFDAIQKRFGKPDRVYGSGRAFLEYGLPNGDTITLVVSGDRVIGSFVTGPKRAGADASKKPPSGLDVFLPERMTGKAIRSANDRTFTKLEFAGFTYWVRNVNLGYGVPRALIGIYAPDREGVFHRSLTAQSWAAGTIEATVDAKTGILELRERADSEIKGQLILSCNLKTIGTQHSIRGK